MLRIGRIKDSVMMRSVNKQFHNVRKQAPFLMKTVTLEGWTLAAQRVVCNMINHFLACKGQLSQLTVSVIMPEGSEEEELRTFMKELGQLCKQTGIHLMSGEVKVLAQVSIPCIQAVGIGLPEAQKQSIRISKEEDYDVLILGTVAREGAAMLARDRESELRERFAKFYVDIAKDLYEQAAMTQAKEVLDREALWATAPVEGGIFAGLWELAAACKVGLDIDLASIPIRQHTIEVCEFFNLNPYMLLSGGCLLLLCRQGQRLVMELEEMGIPAAVIGHSRRDNDKIIHYDDEIRYLEPPKTDEIYQTYDID